jgi:uncharacterized Zn-binding protein involved in type VI secretion
MPGIHVLGDLDEEGNAITDVPQSTVFINNKPVSVDGSLVEGGPTVTANGSPTLFIGGIPVNRTGDEDTSGIPRAEGSADVHVG